MRNRVKCVTWRDQDEYASDKVAARSEKKTAVSDDAQGRVASAADAESKDVVLLPSPATPMRPTGFDIARVSHILDHLPEEPTSPAS